MNMEPKTETENENIANEPQNEPIQENKKKRFNFKEYYASNPEFRERHLQKMFLQK
jgi:hypothetical protein